MIKGISFFLISKFTSIESGSTSVMKKVISKNTHASEMPRPCICACACLHYAYVRTCNYTHIQHEEPECDAGARERVMDTCNIFNVWMHNILYACWNTAPWLTSQQTLLLIFWLSRTFGELSLPALTILARKLEIRIGRGWAEGAGDKTD